MGRPDVFDSALAERVDELEDVKIHACLTIRPRAGLEADPGREHFHWGSWVRVPASASFVAPSSANSSESGVSAS
jgi:hypothetical protein